jgi:DNA-binding response OmpR family regulator
MDANEDVIRGLESGGDDYITKPFDHRVLSARVYAALRRSMDFGARVGAPEAGIIELPPMAINMRSGLVTLDGETIQLTPTELRLLAFFATHAGVEFAAQELLETVWGDLPSINTGTVKKHVSVLKKKLRLDDGSPFKIRCSRKKGYIFSKVIDRPEW